MTASAGEVALAAVSAVAAATSSETATAFVEIGLLALGLAALALVASKLGITAVPFYLVAGLLVGEGGVAQVNVSGEFIELTAEIGVLLLLLTLGLEYSSSELRDGMRTNLGPGALDAVLNFSPGLAAGLLLGWSVPAAILLGGVTWISSSGVISKVLVDLERLGNRETPAILNLLVIEDLAMAVYLPVVAALVIGDDAVTTAATVAVALAVVGVLLWAGGTFGHDLSRGLSSGNNESLLLGVFGITLVVGGFAQQLDVSAPIAAFMVGLALSGSAQERATALIEPLRDLFAAVFFLAFSFQIDPADLAPALVPALGLGAVTAATKIGSGWIAARQIGAGSRGRFRAGTTLIARGEFSIVIAALGATLADGTELGAVAAAYVLLTAIGGPLAAKYADQLLPNRLVAPAGVP